MYEIDERLRELDKGGKPIIASIIGVGQMGSEIISQISLMVGMRVAVAVDLEYETVLKAFEDTGLTNNIVCTNDLKEAEKAAKDGKLIATTDYRLAVQLSIVDVVVDSTGLPEMGARIALECINYKKNIVMMNVECDVTVGPILRKLANNAGLIYSLTAGDEPGSIIELYRFAKAIGYNVVVAGKGKNNPLDIYATPEDCKETAEKRQMNPRMLVEFIDGSKTMIEMAAVSNATGLVPDIRGMHGPKCDINNLLKTFSIKSQGGILNRTGVVDYSIGNVAPGVFIIFTVQNKMLISGLKQRGMGDGPNYLLYRPYHLCGAETPLTIAQTVIYKESTGYPKNKLISECIAITKKDLKKGEILDRIGEYCYRSSIELAEIAKKNNMLPLGLAYGARLKVDVPKDEILTYEMVDFDEDNSILLQLRRIQDKIMS
ncbi:hypothetical protein ES707_15692 [subsurface metagenome]